MLDIGDSIVHLGHCDPQWGAISYLSLTLTLLILMYVLVFYVDI